MISHGLKSGDRSGHHSRNSQYEGITAGGKYRPSRWNTQTRGCNLNLVKSVSNEWVSVVDVVKTEAGSDCFLCFCLWIAFWISEWDAQLCKWSFDSILVLLLRGFPNNYVILIIRDKRYLRGCHWVVDLMGIIKKGSFEFSTERSDKIFTEACNLFRFVVYVILIISICSGCLFDLEQKLWRCGHSN